MALGRANRLKLAKMMVSQKINTTRNGIGIELSVCVNSSKRVCAISVLVCIARACRERCDSFCGESS